MADLFRETAAGQLLHLLTGARVLPYPEEKLDNHLSREKSANFARFGHGGNSTENIALGEDWEAVTKASSPKSTPEDLEQTVTNVVSGEPVHPEKGLNVGIVTWEGSYDPANPQNWHRAKKLYVTFLICFLTFSVYIGSAIYTAGELGIEQQFRVSSTASTLGLTLFVFGYGLGPMFIAPFSEAPPIGRAPVYMLTLVAFVFFNFGVIYATNIGMLLAFRFLTGFLGSPVLATGGASLADMWSRQKTAYAVAIWGLFAVLGPCMGPLVGGFAVQAKGWTWTIWELVWLSGFCMIVLIFSLPETNPETILFKRAKRLRKATGNPSLKSEAEIAVERTPVKQLAIEALWRPFQLCFTEPVLLALNIYLGLIYALLYTWFEAFPIVFNGIYGFDLGQIGLAFLGLLVGSLIILVPYCLWLYYVQEKQFDENGSIAPEKRLPPAIVGSFFIPVCIFWFGWSSRSSVHWIVPIIGSALFPMGAVLLFNAILNYQGDAYPKYVGSVLAGNDMFRAGMGGAFPLFARAMFNRLGVGWASSLLGFLSIAFIPIPMLLYKYGKRLRMASKAARHDI